MKELPLEIIASFKSALKKLTGYERRAYAAELALTYFKGSARKAERVLGVWRTAVTLGLHEQRTGIRCIESFSARGSKKKKKSTPT
jgi:hypothetical protein